MANAAVLSALFGGFDTIRPQATQDIDVDWLLFTDDPGLEVPSPWTKVIEPPADACPCLAAKRYKLLPHLGVPHPDVVWIDANMEVTAPGFAREALAARHDGIATWAHPRRDCIYDEAAASVGDEAQGGKYADQPIREQVAHYRNCGHPEHGGLYACGTIAWDTTDRRVRALGEAWLAECEAWSFQDQLSLPVVARRLGITPGVFPYPQIDRSRRRVPYLENRWLRIWPHR